MEKRALGLLLFLLIASQSAVASFEPLEIACEKMVLSHKPFTLIELTDIALKCNPSTRAAWAQTKTSIANLGLAYSTLWPQINGTLNAQYTTTSEEPTNSSTNSNKPGKRQLNYGPGLTLNYVLWDFGVRTQKIKTANFQLQAAQFSQNDHFQQVILQVEQVYYQLMAQKSLITANESSVRENKKSLEAAHALRTQGMATIGDVYQAESALSQAILALETATGNLKVLEGQLALALGIPIQTAIKLAPMTDKIETTETFGAIEGLMAYAKDNRADFLAAEATVKAAASQLKSIQGQVWPSIQLNTNSQWLRANNTAFNNRTNAVMLSVNIPIFIGFGQKYAEMQAKAQIESAEAARDLLNQQINFQVWQAYYGLKTARRSFETSQKFVKTSEQAAKQAYGQYQEGVGNILTVLSTQATLDTARSQLIQSKMNWYSALAQFSYSIGNIHD